ncbi:MAG: putative zinc transporter msc2 [Watsoniomyces obsoletus]|nr:MAG: putative zinc transporter msc2 [Watsoniomyces obsoletus]
MPPKAMTTRSHATAGQRRTDGDSTAEAACDTTATAQHDPTVETAAPDVADNESTVPRRRRADDLWDDFEMEEEERELNADELAAEFERLEASNREGRLRRRYKELRKEQPALNTPLTSPPSIHRRNVTPARRPRSDSNDAPVDREHKRRMDIEAKYAILSPETFAGGLIAEFRRFERSCEIVFDTSPDPLRGRPAENPLRRRLSTRIAVGRLGPASGAGQAAHRPMDGVQRLAAK